MVNKNSLYKWEVAKLYGVSISTLYRWLLPFKKELKAVDYNKNSRMFTPAQLKVVYEKLGNPEVE